MWYRKNALKKGGKNMKKICLIAAVCCLMMVLTACSGGGQGKAPSAPAEAINPPSETTAPAEQLHGSPVLCSDKISDDYDGYPSEYPVFGSGYQRQQISSVTFLDTLSEMPADAWDVSEAGNGKVMAWVTPNGELYDLYIGAEGGVWAGSSCRDLFKCYQNASEITFGDAFHTENVQDMSRMFSSCTNLTSLDLHGFTTTNVQYMDSMFSYCENLTDVDLSSFDTANVQNMSWMFDHCKSLTTLDLSNFNTANVQDMSWMFYQCHAMTSLELSSFDTSNVQNMNDMFFRCFSLTALDLSSFDTANVQNMGGMFYSCNNLNYLTLSDRFVTTNADTTEMFSHCPAGDDYQHLLN